MENSPCMHMVDFWKERNSPRSRSKSFNEKSSLKKLGITKSHLQKNWELDQAKCSYVHEEWEEFSFEEWN